MNIFERSEVQFGGTRIAYAVCRSPRRTTVSILVDPRQGVVVRAPERMALERLDQVVHAKARWIVERLNSRATHRLAPREFVSGESFLYFGRHYRLRIVDRRDEHDSVRLNGGWLLVPIETALHGDTRARRV